MFRSNHVRTKRTMSVPARRARWLALGGIAGTCLALVSVLVASAGAQPVVKSPENTSAPVISGQPYVGKMLTSTAGTWQNSPTSYSYQWIRCDGLGGNCAQISGATSKTYMSTSADVNHTLA